MESLAGTNNLSADLIGDKTRKILVLLAMILVITAGHFVTPASYGQGHLYHWIHILLRKLYILPVVVGAIWFNLPGAMLTAAVISVSFLPVVSLQWEGMQAENMNQWGELASLWFVAIFGGILIQKEQSLLRQLNQTLRGALESLVSALDVREHDTGTHSFRVREATVWLAKKMGLAPAQIKACSQGALLHDIGKIGIPDNILLKAGPFDDEERSVMNRHPELGRRILESIPGLGEASEIVYAHHERFDGSGYPMGLAEDSIPVGSRVFAVADVLDALTSDRPYRKAQTFDEAKDWIESQEGKHFDPAVIEAFREMTIDEWRRLCQRIVSRNNFTRENFNPRSETHEIPCA